MARSANPGRCIAAALLVVSVACLRPDPLPRFTPAWEPFDANAAGWTTTTTTLLISDCQFHNLYSKPIPERNLSVESAAATAIRPPQLDMFSTDVLAWILAYSGPHADSIVHLGDALDLACESELDDFLAVMEGAGKPWAMAPGNHDFYYFGSYDPEDPELWLDACYGGGAPLKKDRFVRLYVAALVRQQEPGFAELARVLGLAERRAEPVATLAEAVPDAFEWQAVEGTPGFLRSICWNIDREAPWRSFIAQGVNVRQPVDGKGEFRLLLLDSCQYQRRPELIPNAWKSFPVRLNCGFTGEMLPDQLRVVRRWTDPETTAARFLIGCHHPFDSLAPRTRASLGYLWRERQFGMMLSGHTHVGYFVHHDLGGSRDELELNLGSTTDWPMEWRLLRGYGNPSTQEAYIQAERHTLVEALRRQSGYFARGWEVPMGAHDDYRRYKQGLEANDLLVDFYLVHHLVPYWLPQPSIRANKAARATEEMVKNCMLWTYYRLVRTFPTDTGQPAAWPEQCRSDREVEERALQLCGREDGIDDKIAFLQELARFERSRHTRDAATGASTDAERLRFKVSQAAWASRFEHESGRRLAVEDELIRVEWDRPKRPESGGR